MMQTSVRAFVLVLALAGLASTVAPKTAKGKTFSPTSNVIVSTCSPRDPNHCGMD